MLVVKAQRLFFVAEGQLFGAATDFFRHLDGLPAFGFTQQHDEFLTAPAAQYIRLAQAALQYIGKLAQHFVACQVAVGVVPVP